MARIPKKLKDAWPSYLAWLLVVGFALKITIGLHGTFDVTFDDETIYLDGARHLGERFLPLAESSPLYPMWYRALGVLQPDPLELYFLSWFVLTASLPIVLYALARRSGAPLFAAVVVSIVWSLSSSAMTWPFVSKFAALVLAIGALASTFARDGRVAVAVTSMALSAAAYARPELVLPSAAFAAIVFLWCVGSLVWSRPGRRRKGGVLGGAITLAPPALLRLVFGNVGNPFVHGRQFFAFGQHYALNVVEDRQLTIDPWTHWLPLAREAFPTAGSILEAARENPAAFLWHVKRNITALPEATQALLRALPYFPREIEKLTRVALVLTILYAIVAVVLRRSPRLSPPLVRWIPLLVAVGIAAGGSAVLVYPRQHYLLPLTFLMLAAIAGAAGHPFEVRSLSRTRAARVLRAALVLGALGLLALVPTARRGALPALLAPDGPPPPPKAAQENRATIHALRALGLVSLPWGPVKPRANWLPRVVIFEGEYSRGVYAFNDFLRIEQWRKDKPFWQFLHDTWVNVIILNWRMREDAHLKDDPEFVAFVQGTGEREDFELYPVEGTTVVIAVRRSLLQFASVQPKR